MLIYKVPLAFFAGRMVGVEEMPCQGVSSAEVSVAWQAMPGRHNYDRRIIEVAY